VPLKFAGVRVTTLAETGGAAR